MRILQVTPFFSPERGGSVISPYYLSKHLAGRGHEVTLYTTDYRVDRVYARSLEGVRVVVFPCTVNIGMMLFSPGMASQLKKEVNDFDVIHMHNFRSYQNMVAHRCAVRSGVPYMLQAHGSVLPFFQKQGLKRIFDIFFGYRILRDAFKVIALTETEVRQYELMGVDEDRIEVVANGIDLSEYGSLPDRGAFRKKYLIRDDEKIILYLGRIHRIKGLDLLIRAFAGLSGETGYTRLVIVGPDDGFLSTLKEQIRFLGVSERVLFTGPLYGEDKLEAYVDADVYVLPSVYETFPVTVLEACACGTPVVVTDRCGIADCVEGRVGFVIGYDKNQLRDAVSRVLCDEELSRRFGEGGEELVGHEFVWDTIAKKVERLYENAR